MIPWKYIEDYPPPLVRLLARAKKQKRTYPLTDEEIAIKGRLPLSRVREIMFTPSWEEIPVGDMKKFFTGCGFDPTVHKDRHRAVSYTRNGKFVYWTRSEFYESHFLNLLKVLKRTRQNGNT